MLFTNGPLIMPAQSTHNVAISRILARLLEEWHSANARPNYAARFTADSLAIV
jgi:hypothetical protein